MNKGFVTIIVILSIVTLGVFVISTNSLNNNFDDYSIIFLQTKNKISNYSILLNQASQNCFNESNITSCIDSNSSFILTNLGLTSEPYNCNNFNFEEISSNEYLGKLVCNTHLISKQQTIFSNNFSLNIIVKKT